MRWVFSACAAAVLMACGMLAGCRSSGPDEKTATVAAAGGAVTDTMPHFDGQVGQLDNEAGFGEFLDHHVGQRVVLDITIPEDEFQGGETSTSSYFVVYDECDEPYSDSDKPDESKCQGTHYHVPKLNGKTVLTQDEDGDWHLHGVFKVRPRNNPQPAVFSMTLDPVS